MKNSLIHQGLEKSEIRDFLSKSLLLASRFSDKEKKRDVNYDEKRPLESLIKMGEAEIEQMIKKVRKYKEMLAVQSLIESNNWMEFDVSDNTIQDLPEGKMSFIGTEPEFIKILDTIKKENNG